jgi:hypothetical protein
MLHDTSKTGSRAGPRWHTNISVAMGEQITYAGTVSGAMIAAGHKQNKQ